MILYTDVKSDRSTVAILVRDIEIIVIVLGDGPDSAGSSVCAFDWIAIAVRPFIGESVHIICGYCSGQFNSAIRGSINRGPFSSISIFIF